MKKQELWSFFTKRLADLIQSERMPHLLVLSGEANQTKAWFSDTALELFLPQASARTEDLLWLTPKNQEYRLEDIDAKGWASFFSHRPTHSAYRLIVFEQSEALSVRVANRLLKDLEDTPPWLVIVMLQSGASKMLPTIKSRALTWRLPRTDNLATVARQKEEWLSQVASAALQKEYGRLPELLREDDFNETELMELLHLSFLNKSESLSFEHCEKWLSHLRWWQESEIFNQARWERLLPFCVFSAGEFAQSSKV